MKDGKELSDGMKDQMLGRIRNVLVVINSYRAKHMESARIENIMTQLEQVESVIMEDGRLSYREKVDLDFNQIEGTPLEHDEHLDRELYSIKNFVENAL